METDAVLEWLNEHHPELARTAEIDRNWVWLCCGESLKGDEPEKVATRKSISDFGFRWAPRGHLMPSGHTGIWAHSCLVPKKFEGRARPQEKPKQTRPRPGKSNGPGPTRRIDPFEQREATQHLAEPIEPDPAAIAFFQ